MRRSNDILLSLLWWLYYSRSNDISEGNVHCRFRSAAHRPFSVFSPLSLLSISAPLRFKCFSMLFSHVLANERCFMRRKSHMNSIYNSHGSVSLYPRPTDSVLRNESTRLSQPEVIFRDSAGQATSGNGIANGAANGNAIDRKGAIAIGQSVFYTDYPPQDYGVSGKIRIM